MLGSHWNTGVLSAACVTLGCALGVLLGGAVAPPVAYEPWLSTYQGLIGAVLGVLGAGAGLAIATGNVLRQMRVNLISREEDRIERVLPGLRDALGLLQRFELLSGLSLRGLLAEFDSAGLHSKNANVAQQDSRREETALAIARLLPQSDRPTRDRVGLLLFALHVCGLQANSWDMRSEEEGGLGVMFRHADAESELATVRRQIVSEMQSLDARIRRLESTLTSVRAEIESYFAR